VPTTIADVRVPADAFPLGRLLAEFPAGEVELERAVPTDGRFLPLFWVDADTAATVGSTLDADDQVASHERLTTTRDRALYAVEWLPGIDGLVDVLANVGADMLRGRATGSGWEFRLLVPHQRQLQTLRRACEERSIPLDVVRVFHPDDRAADAALTDPQREALTMALDDGYFEVPRRVTQRDLAERAGVSANAMSQRLRRGTRVAVAALIRDDDP
jgi:predicted DNA binding protein